MHRNILWNKQQMRQCAVEFISLQVHSTCFGRHTRPSPGVQFQLYQQPLVQFIVGPRSSRLLPPSVAWHGLVRFVMCWVLIRMWLGYCVMSCLWLTGITGSVRSSAVPVLVYRIYGMSV